MADCGRRWRGGAGGVDGQAGNRAGGLRKTSLLLARRLLPWLALKVGVFLPARGDGVADLAALLTRRLVAGG